MFGHQVRCLSTKPLFAAAGKKVSQKPGYLKNNGPAPPKKGNSNAMTQNWKRVIATSKFNSNAESVSLPKLDLDNIKDEVVTYTDKQYNFLRRLGSFKMDQFHELFQRPIVLTTKRITERFLQELESSTTKRFIITGEPGVGKSTLLAQVHVHALKKGAIVLEFPYPELFTSGRNDFFYDGTKYIQPTYLKILLTKLRDANDRSILASLKLKNSYRFPVVSGRDGVVTHTAKLDAGTSTLLQLVSVNTESKSRGKLFAAVFTELVSQNYVPVYFTVDNFSRISSSPYTYYKNAINQYVHLLQFQVAKTIFNLVGGKVQAQHKDSCVIVANSGVDRVTRTLNVATEKDEEEVSYMLPQHYDPLIANYLQQGGITEFRVPKLNKTELGTLLQFYSKSKILRETYSSQKSMDQIVDEQYFISGNGNPRELLKSITLNPK
ncbi:HER098Wp [Eremothecium sinecaudum]|uniref:Small ribosomal subunit protein mS29 n=1 Tax=Eremothecium sinecaudum TaxID=45286 RepID=A0A109UXH4_9SACH|nr:HER098Wp [Eremothecium sinecaudum]AMD21377.1 HER098Wp [Eremothecium sinecaudum]